MSLSRTPISRDRLENVRRRLDAWRRTRCGRERIPERLWTAAVQMAGVYGLCITARTLRLDYVALKRHVESARRQGPPGPEPAMSFVEVRPPEPTAAPECLLELEDPRGVKMRIHLQGVALPDVVALSQCLWSGEVRPGASRRRPA
jgi:hypothetical protein